MSVLRIMLFMLAAKITNQIQYFKSRVSADLGLFESESCIEAQLNTINNQNLLDSASLIVTPNAYKTNKLYSVVPFDASGYMTFTRATSATRVNSLGLIETVGINVPRIDYTNASCPSILVEPQRTNLVFPSATATTQSRTVTATAHTLSFYGTGSITLSGVATGTLNGTGINNKVSLTFTPTAGSLILTVSGSVNNWQLEVGSNATSYIPTTTTTVTRNADVISKTGISDLIGQTEGTLYFEGFLRRNASIGRILAISEATLANRAILNITNNRIEFINRSNSSVNGSINPSALSEIVTGVNKIAVRYKSGNTALYVNGVLVNENTQTFNYSLTMPNFYFVRSEISVDNPNTALVRLAMLFKTTLTNSQLATLTTL